MIRISAEVFDGMHLSVHDGTVRDLSHLAADKASVQRVGFRECAAFIPRSRRPKATPNATRRTGSS